jgi:DNA invertase Pin-like site-specific DNA recombinase
MKAAIYARVSTIHAGQDPTMQTSELREYAARRGWTVVGEYVDQGVSGSRESRPALNKLLEVVHERKCDVVLVWKLDRWARSLRNLVNSLADLEARGVAFVSLRDNVDLTTPSGRLMVQIIGAMAEFERSLIVERVRAGMRNARSKGKHLGRPTRSLDGRRIASMRAQGLGWKKIAREMGCGVSTVLRVGQAEEKRGSVRPAESGCGSAVLSVPV